MRFVLALTLAGVVAVAGTAAQARGTKQGIPNGFEPLTAAAVGAHDLWVLGAYRCGSATLCDELLRSTDSDKHFGRVLQPPSTTSADEPTLVFANARVGYSYVSRGALYITRDGGETWKRALGQPIMAFAVAGGNAYAVTGRCARNGCRGFQLHRSSVSHTAWRTLPFPFRNSLPFTLAAHGSQLWMNGQARSEPNSTDRLAQSSDDGRTFTIGKGPCFADLGAALVPAGDNVVWAVCGTGMLSITYRSTNGGRTFVSKHRYAQTNRAQIVAASPPVAVLNRGEGIKPPLLLRTTNGGSTWHSVQEPRAPQAVSWLGFTSSHVGYAVVQLSSLRTALWRTTDGGATWHSLPIR